MSISSSANFTNNNTDNNITTTLNIKINTATVSLHIFFVAALISTCVCVLNPLTIVTILSTPSLRKCHSNIFLINLAVVDLLFMLIVVALVAKSWMGSFDWVLCVVSLVYLSATSSASMLSCFAIAVDRFLFIHKAMTYSRIVTHDRVRKVVASIWIASGLTGLLPIADGRLIGSRCHHQASDTVTIQGVASITMYCITAVISICLYTKLFFVIREHNKLLEHHAQSHSLTHKSSNQACTVKTRLGECQFRHHDHSCSTWSAGDNPTNNVRIKMKRIMFNYKVRSSPSSLPSASRTDRSHTFTSEENVSVSLIDEPTGTISRISSHKTEAKDHIHAKNPEVTAAVEAGSTAAPRGRRKKRPLGQCQHLKDFKTIRALMMMFVIYFICWAPVMSIKLWHQVLHKHVSERWMNAAWTCAMSNSVWNFVVYPLRKKDFRDSMFKMVRHLVGLQSSHRRPRTVPTESGSVGLKKSLKMSSSRTLRLFR